MRNSYDLAAIIRAKGIKRKAIKFRPAFIPKTFENAAAKKLAPLAATWKQVVSELVLPAYERALSAMSRDAATVTRDATSEVKSALDEAARRTKKVVAQISPELGGWAVDVEEWQREKFQAGVRAAVGSDVFPYLSGADVAPQVDAARSRFSSLVTKMDDQTRGKIEETVWRELLNQTPRNEIGKMLAAELDIDRKRANFIAKDQTLKLSSMLNGLRQQQAGIEKYIWVTAGDERVRESHAEKEGKVFSWNDPPADTGHPGEDINCRCTSQAYIDLMGDDGDE